MPANVLPDAPGRQRRIRNEPGFTDRLLLASEMVHPVYSRSEYIEEQLYERGFFPAEGDEGRFNAFHAAAPHEKFMIAQAMGDVRARYIAARIMYNEWPRAVPPDEYSRLDQERATRHHGSDGPWMTKSKALAEIAKLRSALAPDAVAILEEHQGYLLTLREPDTLPPCAG